MRNLPHAIEKDSLLLDLAKEFVFHHQLHTRRGSHGGKVRQQPLADEAQSDLWLRARDWLRYMGQEVPPSGTLRDG